MRNSLNMLMIACLTGTLLLAGCGSKDTVNNTTADSSSANANLSLLQLSNGKLDPSFSPGVTNYSALFVGDTYLRVTPHTAEAGAGVSVNQTPQEPGVQSAPISLATGTNVITVTVTAPDGSAKKTYTITAHRVSQEAYVKASDTAMNDQFGNSVSLSGDTLAVGAPFEGPYGSGAVYLFTRTGTVWTQQQKLKTATTGTNQLFGYTVSLSGDTVAIGAVQDYSNATGINGDPTDQSAPVSGAVYIFTRNGTTWTQQAYIKASNTASFDRFGSSVSVSGDTLAVGAIYEASNAKGVNGDQANNSATYSGAVYVFTRSGTTWSQQAYIKASNTAANSFFGSSVALSGETLAVGAYGESSNATGVNGDQNNVLAPSSGAVYIFTRATTTWSQQAYIKASNTAANAYFGTSVSLSNDTLAVGATGESSGSAGVNGDQYNASAPTSGAAYIFTRTGTGWTQQVYIKASNPDTLDVFGSGLALSGDTLAVGATNEASSATGVNRNQADNSMGNSGAVYVFTRSGTAWSQQDYLKASNTTPNGNFGVGVSVEGDTIVVGGSGDKSSATGINGNQTDTSAGTSGAVFVLR